MRDTDATPRPQELNHEEKANVPFSQLGLRAEVMRALTDMGFTEPTAVQAATIPRTRAGKDLLVQSRTGSGKTAAFAIPFADWLVDENARFVQALVLLPTRELALQVAAETSRICAHTNHSVVPVYGGSPMGRQVEQLKAGGQIVCGTPGRILDHIRRGTLDLSHVKCAVLDECDEMLSMGFQEDIETILENTPSERQTLLFSATIPEGIQRLSRRFLRDPETLKLSADFVGVHEIRHIYYSIPGGNREGELLRILEFEAPERAVVFCNTREETSRIAEHLRRHGMDADAISSDLSQSERENVMQRMRAGKIQFLVATDVAARGIDIENLPCVVNYTFPDAPELYIHRTGRTGRAGRSGQAISLIGPTEVGAFYYLKLLYKIRPEERALPSETEVRSRREGEKITQLRAALKGEVEGEWLTLARRLMLALDGEKLVAMLARDRLTNPNEKPSKGRTGVSPSVAAPAPSAPMASRNTSSPAAADAPSRPERSSSRRDAPRERPQRDRPRTDLHPRDEAPRGSSGPRSPSHETEREFWEIWSEEAGRTLPAAQPVTPPSPLSISSDLPKAPAETVGYVRLYVNLGKKDNLTVQMVAEHLSAAGTPIPPESIELMNTHTYVNVPAAIAEQLCAQISKSNFAGRSVVCEPARPPRRR